MATTKRQKRNADTPARRKAAPTPAPEMLAPISAVVLEPGDAELNDAPTLTLPAVQNEPEPEFVPPPAEPATPAAPATPRFVTDADDLPPPSFGAAEPRPAQGIAAAAPAAPAASLSPAEERAVFQRRRLAGLAALVLVVLLAGFLGYRFLMPQDDAVPPAPPAQAGAPVQPAQPEQAAPPAAQQPAAPAAQAPAAPAQQPAAPQAADCSAIQGLPVIAGATCTEFDRDEDDGVVKLKNTYIVSAAAADVNRFYVDAFKQNGWTIAEMDSDLDDAQWDYKVTQGARELQVKIEAQESAQGNATELKIAED